MVENKVVLDKILDFRSISEWSTEGDLLRNAKITNWKSETTEEENNEK